jgi:hypothetical protein
MLAILSEHFAAALWIAPSVPPAITNIAAGSDGSTASTLMSIIGHLKK